jgi:hypothetical protein
VLGVLFSAPAAKYSDPQHVNDIFCKLITEIEKTSGEAPAKENDCTIL